jgi:hypothetical protein
MYGTNDTLNPISGSAEKEHCADSETGTCFANAKLSEIFPLRSRCSLRSR